MKRRFNFDVAQAQATFQRENWLALSSPVADQTRAQVQVQVVWNPAAVRTWRIVGYENRVTSAAAFTQDRAWSQSSDLVSSGEVVQLQDNHLLAFGAVVALTADRYSALRDGSVSDRGIARELWSLRDWTVDLQNDLGHLAAFKDFASVQETLLMNVPRVAPDSSGYSR